MSKKKDMTGKRFGKLRVIEEAGRNKQRNALWKCRCDCGKEFTTSGILLRRGDTVSCGAHKGGFLLKDITGERFCRLLVLAQEGKTKYGAARWLCRCDCGKEKIVTGFILRQGQTKSCGCLKTESSKENLKRAHAARNLASGRAERNRMLGQYRRSAKLHQFSFDLTEEEFDDLTQHPCYYCGSIGSAHWWSKSPNGPYIANGIDRVDNSKGYSMTNCVACCRTCNMAKRTMASEEFIAWIHRCHEHLNQTVVTIQ